MKSSSSGRIGTVAGVLIVFAPILIPAALVLLLLLVFLVLIVVHAFADGFAEGCAALGMLIGAPSVLVLWLRAVGRVLNIPRRPPPAVPAVPRPPTIAERYESGDFVHRDYEEERREWESRR